MNKLIVISGCSSGGKSTLITELSQQGYSVISEAGVEEYNRLIIAYPQYGYELLELPLAGVKERAVFVVSMLEGNFFYAQNN